MIMVIAWLIEAGSARFADLSSHSQPHKVVMENILHYIIFQNQSTSMN